MDPILEQLADIVRDTQELGDMVRPLLELLEAVTGLESIYLTRIDLEQSTQQVLYARNTKALRIPAELVVPWGDTLCKRALDENRPYTRDVAACWGDSAAARELGIKTYLSAPIRTGDGELFGTLCAASGDSVAVSAAAMRLLGLFANLIALQLERERLLRALREENRAFKQRMLSDPLTGIANRRALLEELERRLTGTQHPATALLQVAFIDLDGFKAINDTHGHDVGDRLLIAIARRLTEGLRADEFVARLGGDEFVVLAECAPGDPARARDSLRARLKALTRGRFDLGVLCLDYAGPSIGIVTWGEDGAEYAHAVLGRADAAMYADKHARRATSDGTA